MKIETPWINLHFFERNLLTVVFHGLSEKYAASMCFFEHGWTGNEISVYVSNKKRDHDPQGWFLLTLFGWKIFEFEFNAAGHVDDGTSAMCSKPDDYGWSYSFSFPETPEDTVSADNGIYIGKFPKIEGGFEWRVIHAQAIENCEDGLGYPEELIDAYRTNYFGSAPVFNSEQAATEDAHRQYKMIMDDDLGVCEYGIAHFDFERPLKLNSNEASRVLDDFWKKIEDKKLIGGNNVP